MLKINYLLVFNKYVLAFDELNIITKASFYLNNDSDLKKRTAQITDDILSVLINAYALGIDSAAEMLGCNLSVHTDLLRDAVYCLIDGRSFGDRAAEHIANNDLTALQTLVQSEYHRVYNTAVTDGGDMFSRRGNQAVTKTWRTVRDDRVRETHSYLEGQAVGLYENFYTFDGDYALFPGGFRNADNNVNCRCTVLLSR